MIQVKVRYERSAGGSRDTYSEEAENFAEAASLAAEMVVNLKRSGWNILRIVIEEVK